MLKLYHLPLSLNSYKVRLLLAFLGVQYEGQIVDLMKGEHKAPEFLALNPFGQVPLLQDGKLLLRDSHAIIVWLARKHGGEQWMPRDADQEAVVNAWLAAAAFELRLGPYDARLAKLFPVLCVNYHTVREKTAHALHLFEDRLKGREWLALDHPTVADVAAYPAIAHSSDGDISLDGYNAIQAWLTRVEKLPGFVRLLD
jgi:glutathione S-transferase